MSGTNHKKTVHSAFSILQNTPAARIVLRLTNLQLALNDGNVPHLRRNKFKTIFSARVVCGPGVSFRLDPLQLLSMVKS